MKIAVASESNEGLEATVSGHFRMCPYFTVLNVENGEVEKIEIKENTFADGHGQPGELPNFIKSLGAEVIIAGGMGPKAVNFFNQFGIKTVTNVSGKIEDILKNL